MHENPELVAKIKKVLTKFNSEVDPNAIIAGGAALHLSTGAMFSDVDVYYTLGKNSLSKVHKIIKSLNDLSPPKSTSKPDLMFESDEEESDSASEYEVCEGTTVTNYAYVEGQKFQFMQIDGIPAAHVLEFAGRVFNSFDINVCKVASFMKDGNLFTYASKDHEEDILKKRLTLHIGRSYDSDQKTLCKRLPKYMDKFPGFKVNIDIKKTKKKKEYPAFRTSPLRGARPSPPYEEVYFSRPTTPADLAPGAPIVAPPTAWVDTSRMAMAVNAVYVPPPPAPGGDTSGLRRRNPGETLEQYSRDWGAIPSASWVTSTVPNMSTVITSVGTHDTVPAEEDDE